MHRAAYLFEVRGVQNLLFAGGKLRDVVTASDQLDALCGAPLDNVLQVCGLQESTNIWFSRRASGAIYAILNDRSKAEKFRNLWSFYVRKHFPSIEIVQTLHSADNTPKAMSGALDLMRERRNLLLAQYPVPSPFVRRSSRTGQAVVAFDSTVKEWVDEATKIKRNNHGDNSSLLKKFTVEGTNLRWPKSIDPDDSVFPFLDDNHSVALIHADGNGMGELLITLSEVINQTTSSKSDPNIYIELFRMFSNAIETATQKAALDATQVLIKSSPTNSVLPARPLVLGGDDLTIMVRSDLAIDFTKTFCLSFEKHTASELAPLNTKIRALYANQGLVTTDDMEHKLNRFQFLTACGGIAFIKAKQPFLQAYDLAESLCDEAKKHSKNSMNDTNQPIPSSISFHGVSSPLIQKVDQVRSQEWEVIYDKKECYLSMGTYNLEKLGIITQLASLFGKDQLNKSGLRQVAGLLKIDPVLAQNKYTRWRQISAKHHSKELSPRSEVNLNTPLIDQFDQLIYKLVTCGNHKIPIDEKTNESPLLDLLLLLDIPSPQPEQEEMHERTFTN